MSATSSQVYRNAKQSAGISVLVDIIFSTTKRLTYHGLLAQDNRIMFIRLILMLLMLDSY